MGIQVQGKLRKHVAIYKCWEIFSNFNGKDSSIGSYRICTRFGFAVGFGILLIFVPHEVFWIFCSGFGYTVDFFCWKICNRGWKWSLDLLMLKVVIILAVHHQFKLCEIEMPCNKQYIFITSGKIQTSNYPNHGFIS